jgi:hypothetical protein
VLATVASITDGDDLSLLAPHGGWKEL